MVGKSSVSISQADPNRVYALVEAEGDNGGVFVSSDGGESWAKVNGSRNLLQRAFYYLHIYADPQQVDTAYAVNTGAIKSTDGGKTWTNMGTPHGDNHAFWINPTNNQTLINGNDGGANVSLDGGRTWSTQNNQLTAELYRIETDTRWPYWIYASQQDNSNIGVPSTGNADPFSVAGGESGYIAVDPRNANIIYAGNYGGTIERTDRYSGISESVRVYADEETGPARRRHEVPLPVERADPHVAAQSRTSSTRRRSSCTSTDGGQTWTIISPDLTRNDKSKQDYSGVNGITRDDTGVEVYDTIFAFEESPVTAGLFWAGTDDGLLQLSRDGGKSWTEDHADRPARVEHHQRHRSLAEERRPCDRDGVSLHAERLQAVRLLTNDFGKTWKRIADGTNGIPDGDYTRVVREDPDARAALCRDRARHVHLVRRGGALAGVPAEPAAHAGDGPEGLSQEPDCRDRRALVLDRRRAPGRAGPQAGTRTDQRRLLQAGRCLSPGRAAADVLLLVQGASQPPQSPSK